MPRIVRYVRSLTNCCMRGCRMFGSTGICAGCGQNIPPNEMVLKASTGSQRQSSTTPSAAVYHVQCFSCAACHCRLTAGDKYRIVSGHIICGDHDLPGHHQPAAAPGSQTSKQHHAAGSAAVMSVQIPASSQVTPAARLQAAVPPSATGSSHGARSRQKVRIKH